MKALIYEQPECLRYGESPPPTEGESIVVAAAGICGSDMHAFLGHDERRPPPLILGHEAAGESNGKQVIINPLVVCGSCEYCHAGRDNLCPHREIISMPPREGAFAEITSVPSDNMLALPSSLSPQQGALAEPLACGHRTAGMGLQYCRRPPEECTAAILGGGAIGLAAALSLSARGVRTIYIAETNTTRIPILQNIGDFIVVSPDKLPPADVVVDAVGIAATRERASAIVVPGGAVAHIGLGEQTGGFDMRRLTLQESVLCGVYTYTAAEFEETVRWMAEGRLGALDWFETRPLKDGARAFADLRDGKVAAPKILLIP